MQYPNRPFRPGSLGRLLEEQEPILAYSSPEFTPYEVVSQAPVPQSVNDDQLPVRVLQTMSASTGTASTGAGTVSLPQFNFSTSVEECSDCNSNTASATKLNTSPVPLPEAPSTVNWLLIAAIAAVGVVIYKSGPASGLAGAPATEPVALGRPPRRKPEKPTKPHRHVAELTIK